jgi:hypothetical protein
VQTTTDALDALCPRFRRAPLLGPRPRGPVDGDDGRHDELELILRQVLAYFSRWPSHARVLLTEILSSTVIARPSLLAVTTRLAIAA